MRIVFIADLFLEDAVGGSELSIQGHIDTCQYPYIKIKSKDFRLKDLKKDDFIIFGNYYDLIKADLSVFRDYDYVIEECDYKYCKFRSKHLHILNSPQGCDCPSSYSRPVIDFMLNSKHIFWKSEGQKDEYYRIFAELRRHPSTVIGSIFSDKILDYIVSLKDLPHDEYYMVLKSNQWIKGYRESVAYCVKHQIPYREIEKLPYEEAMLALAKSKGLVYMPSGFDVSCRMVTEAKLMGRDVICSDKVQHTKEDWFNSGTEGMLKHLKSRNNVFWEIINGHIFSTSQR
jgi:hypothetical protein